MKFKKFHLLKRQNWLQQNYYVQKRYNLIIVVAGIVKQCGAQIVFWRMEPHDLHKSKELPKTG